MGTRDKATECVRDFKIISDKNFTTETNTWRNISTYGDMCSFKGALGQFAQFDAAKKARVRSFRNTVLALR